MAEEESIDYGRYWLIFVVRLLNLPFTVDAKSASSALDIIAFLDFSCLHDTRSQQYSHFTKTRLIRRTIKRVRDLN